MQCKSNAASNGVAGNEHGKTTCFSVINIAPKKMICHSKNTDTDQARHIRRQKALQMRFLRCLKGTTTTNKGVGEKKTHRRENLKDKISLKIQ
jgi:hypothetical protein